MALFSKGIILAQHKEPALSRPLLRFVNPQTDSMGARADKSFNVDKLTPDQLIAIAKAAQIVDERDGRLLYRKLQRAQKRRATVVADAVDDEPYVSSKLAVLLRYGKEVAESLRLCQRIAQGGEPLILVYKMLSDLEISIPRSVDRIKVARIRGGYPAGSLRAHLGEGAKVVVGTGALLHFYRAVYELRQQGTVFLTVAGNCIANPMNLEASIGMTVMHVLERCGLSDEPTRVVCGGSMTGIAIMDAENTLVTFTTRAVLAFKEDKADRYYNCIGCGRCERVCPAGLNPMYIRRFVQNSYWANLRPFDAHLCVGCGTCSYICPSKLDVAGAVSKAKEYADTHFVSGGGEEEELEAEIL